MNRSPTYAGELSYENFYWTDAKYPYVFEKINKINSQYESFIENIEAFFNQQIETDEEFNSLNDEGFYLTDKNEEFSFPCKKIGNKIKVVQSPLLRMTILFALQRLETEIDK